MDVLCVTVQAWRAAGTAEHRVTSVLESPFAAIRHGRRDYAIGEIYVLFIAVSEGN